MNDHLDECPEVFIDCYGTLCDCEYSHFCICDALRACEERVRGEEQQRIEAALRSVGQHDAAWELAIRESTLRDAREAVAALAAGRERMDYEDGPQVYGAHNAYIDSVNDAISAIDALRKETND